jgi:hypothetical protein
LMVCPSTLKEKSKRSTTAVGCEGKRMENSSPFVDDLSRYGSPDWPAALGASSEWRRSARAGIIAAVTTTAAAKTNGKMFCGLFIILTPILKRHITPELTGRAHDLESVQVLDESRAIRAPVE